MKYHSINRDYRKRLRKKTTIIVFIFVLTIIFILIALLIGSAEIKIEDIFKSIFTKETSGKINILWYIRFPRVIAAVLTGTLLSVSGAAMQSLLRNPLASPVSLGISHAAAFGAAFAIVVLGAGSMHSNLTDAVIFSNLYLVTLSAFVWSLISTFIILFIAKLKGSAPETIILSGIVIGSLFTASTSALQYFADDVQLSSIVFWLFGDIGKASLTDLWGLFIVSILVVVFFIKNRWNYNALNAGDETAMSLGVNVNKVRLRGMIIASLSTGFAVAYFGVIAFVGLVVPHLVRRIIGSDERFLIPASALFGGLFLLFADTVARTIISPVVLPVGILTSFIGAPVFIYLLVKGIKRF